MKKAALLYNPTSGDGRMSQSLDLIISTYQKFGFSLDLVRLDGTIDLVDRMKDFKEYDHILISGGDGTVNVCLNAMLKSGFIVPIGILPSGTANDFARYIGMPINNIEEALRQIHMLPVQEMDLPIVNGSAFINVLSAGFFTDISQKTDQDLKNTIGKLAYYMKSIEMLREMKKTKIVLSNEDGVLFQGEMYMMFIFNGVSAGTIKVSGESLANDGLLEILVVKASTIPELVPPAIGILKGDSLNKLGNNVLYFQGSSFTVEGEEGIPTDMDGEKGPDMPLKVTCLNKKLKVLGVKGI